MQSNVVRDGIDKLYPCQKHTDAHTRAHAAAAHTLARTLPRLRLGESTTRKTRRLRGARRPRRRRENVTYKKIETEINNNNNNII